MRAKIEKIVFFRICTILCVGLIFGGCSIGNDTPKDVAVKFVEALSNKDIDNAKELSSEKVHKDINRLINSCNKPFMKKLAYESIDVFKLIKKNGTNSKISNLGLEANKQISSELRKRYGSTSDIDKLPKDEQKQILDKFYQDYAIPIKISFIKDVFKILNIKTDNPEKVQYILAKYTISKGKNIRYITQNYVMDNPNKITSECIAKYTDFSFVDKINFIETTQESPDKASVRMEIIYKDGKAKKVSVDVEQIKKEWKVSYLPLNFY